MSVETTALPQLTFKRCFDCEDELPHGYLCVSDRRQYVPFASIAGGKYLINLIKEALGNDYSDQTERLAKEMAIAGLPEEISREAGTESEHQATIKELFDYDLRDHYYNMHLVRVVTNEPMPKGVEEEIHRIGRYLGIE